MSPLKIQYAFTEQEALRSNRALTDKLNRRMWFILHVLPPLALVGIGYGVYLAATGKRSVSEETFPLVLCAFFAAAPLWVNLEIKRNFRRNPNAGKTISWEFSAESITYSGDGSAGRFEWRNLMEVKEAKYGFLLYPQPRLAHWIPKHAFPNRDDIEAFRDMIRKSGVKYHG